MIREEGETQEDFIKRLRKYSTEFNQVIAATDWLGSQKNTPICFMHVSDYTNDDLYKIIKFFIVTAYKFPICFLFDKSVYFFLYN